MEQNLEIMGSKMSALSFIGGWGGCGWHCGVWCRKTRKRETIKRKSVFPFWVYSEISSRKWNYGKREGEVKSWNHQFIVEFLIYCMQMEIRTGLVINNI